MASPSTTSNALEVFERELIRGRARWVADLQEFFKGFRIRETTFAIYARGGTRNRGFFMSRFFAWSALPNYDVALLCWSKSQTHENLTPEKFRKIIDDSLFLLKQKELKWVWLILFQSSPLQTWAVSQVSRHDRQELGISLVCTTSGQVVVSANQVGRSIQKHIGLNRLMEKIAK